jgi:hypothetical protein
VGVELALFFFVGGGLVWRCGVGAVVVVAARVACAGLVDASVDVVVGVASRREGVSGGKLWSGLWRNDDVGDFTCFLSVELTVSYSASLDGKQKDVLAEIFLPWKGL